MKSQACQVVGHSSRWDEIVHSKSVQEQDAGEADMTGGAAYEQHSHPTTCLTCAQPLLLQQATLAALFSVQARSDETPDCACCLAAQLAQNALALRYSPTVCRSSAATPASTALLRCSPRSWRHPSSAGAPAGRRAAQLRLGLGMSPPAGRAGPAPGYEHLPQPACCGICRLRGGERRQALAAAVRRAGGGGGSGGGGGEGPRAVGKPWLPAGHAGQLQALSFPTACWPAAASAPPAVPLPPQRPLLLPAAQAAASLADRCCRCAAGSSIPTVGNTVGAGANQMTAATRASAATHGCGQTAGKQGCWCCCCIALGQGPLLLMLKLLQRQGQLSPPASTRF